MIELKSVTKTYGKKKNTFTALDDVSFVIPDGATVAIVGKSGSGKSTLMHAMSGLDRPEVGEVIIDGDNILTLKAKAVDAFRSEKMAFIFQSFFVQGNESCYNNVSLPLEIAKVPLRNRRAKILAALKAVGLDDKVKSRARDLSGGQKQRLAIARAIVGEPTVLFADEPTGNLDSTTGAQIEKLLFDYNKKHKATLVIVTHDHDIARKCQIQIMIKDGKVQSIEEAKR
ncbi:putative Lipoprotein-releasing system ATP-binding protein LolD [Candidatus Saccharimonas aalborgensis]|jgi:putative ABC transport system ATP-binding protein|uniref:Putative Lipoprotein-releasing system ATP-binding protein LolD n=1 Tax=Candidatus Saccharimonas aalborgensis TaxID=1332188 RepID=R4PNC7_9BACT|nr:ABC transporter ATP-binding protein [Candidatus Saccharimonas aalborgensis]AGL62459.1 putative Lipoprotein-releasing system ATP-binding protein LolD [Candidatus Saccharimonas aalborgensis]QQR51211.1 MAG: ABC transporter ATP-binding protein [Candidatus Saccharibacteria bacterium]QQS67961.1 MAG: ABC transporter ATP-binding protein [Candidatus Saccharibacteria bacterium]QQS70302.1 MAG: ABC transporter ATP-binding protein [Candidatus Saccharibacteria bacterium]